MRSEKHRPPLRAQKLLLWFLRSELAEEVAGDLEERFEAVLKRKPLFRARMDYWYQVLHYIRPFALKRLRRVQSNHYTMFQSYFRIGYRNLLRNKGYSFINIGGLAMGMAVALLIGLWVYDELSFDRYHENHARIARVVRTGRLNGNVMPTPYLPFPLGDELRASYGSNFKHVVRVWPANDHMLAFGEKKLTRKGVFMEAGGPAMFTLRMLKGNWSALKDQHSIILSASLARTIFGDEEPIGQALKVNSQLDVTVTGVYEDLPANTHFHGVEFFSSWDLFASINQWLSMAGYGLNSHYVYVELQPNADIQKVSASIKDIILKKIQEDKEYVAANPQLFLHPMDQWHLYSEWKSGAYQGGLIRFVWLFAIIGIAVLLLACINFMNLSTARSEKRAKEVGVRKAIGSNRGQLINQFFSESFMVVLLAFLLAMGISYASLPWFNVIAFKQIAIPVTSTWFWIGSAVFILFTGLLAGSYPALHLSSFQPVKVLKGTFRAGRLASLPRKVLVVVQFAVSVTLVIGTVIVYQQIRFAKNRPVGYDREGLMMFLMTSPEVYLKRDALHAELLNTGVVEQVAESSSPVTAVWSSNGSFDWDGKRPGLQTDFGTLIVTPTYGKTVGWKFMKGRDFSVDIASDSTGLVINETAARFIGLEDPVSATIRWNGAPFKVLGVINDMVMESPYATPMPTVFYLGGYFSWMNIRISHAVNPHDALPKIEAVFKRVVPSVAFDYKFADQEYDLKFAAEERIGKLAFIFTALSILISCLGLFGLASFVAEQRTKEIGIRKVVGASVFSLWRMLSKDFVVLVIISSTVAIPVAYYFLSQWIEGFEYHTALSWWTFIASSLGAIAITLLTVSYQAVKAALMSPVKSLRSE